MKAPEPQGRADHQQRLDLGPRAAAELGPLHRDQARDHRPDQIDLARRPQVRHRLRPDRHRQRRHRHDPAHDGGRARRPTARMAVEPRMDVRPRRQRRRLHGEPAARRQRPVHDRDGDQDAVHRAGLTAMTVITVTPSPKRVRVRFNGAIVADTRPGPAPPGGQLPRRALSATRRCGHDPVRAQQHIPRAARTRARPATTACASATAPPPTRSGPTRRPTPAWRPSPATSRSIPTGWTRSRKRMHDPLQPEPRPRSGR